MESKFLLTGFLFFLLLLILPEIILYVLPDNILQSGILFTIFLIVLSIWLCNEENNKLTKRKESTLVKNSIFETVKFEDGHLYLTSSQLFQCLYTHKLETNIGSFSVTSKPPPSNGSVGFPSIGTSNFYHAKTNNDRKFYSNQQEFCSLELNGEFRFEFSIREPFGLRSGGEYFGTWSEALPVPRILILRKEAT